jgi:hypothetical protein
MQVADEEEAVVDDGHMEDADSTSTSHSRASATNASDSGIVLINARQSNRTNRVLTLRVMCVM